MPCLATYTEISNAHIQAEHEYHPNAQDKQIVDSSLRRWFVVYHDALIALLDNLVAPRIDITPDARWHAL